MQSSASKSFTRAKMLILTIGGFVVGFYFFDSLKATILSGVAGFLISVVWQ